KEYLPRATRPEGSQAAVGEGKRGEGNLLPRRRALLLPREGRGGDEEAGGGRVLQVRIVGEVAGLTREMPTNASLLSRLEGEGVLRRRAVREELVEFATRNIRRAGLEKIVEIHQGDGSKGWPPLEAEEIYDRIVFTAAASRLPEAPVRQLRREGVLLVPLGGSPAQILTRVVK